MIKLLLEFANYLAEIRLIAVNRKVVDQQKQSVKLDLYYHLQVA